MSGGEFAAIEAHVQTWKYVVDAWGLYCKESVEMSAELAESAPALLAAVRERDNTIARVRDIVEDYDSLGISPYVADALRAALDPQETP